MQNFLKIQIHLAVKVIGNERVENYQIGVIVWILPQILVACGVLESQVVTGAHNYPLVGRF